MKNGNGNSGVARHFPDVLDDWITDHEALLDALVVLREMDDCDEAISALLALRPIAVGKASWALWAGICDLQDLDAAVLLHDRIPHHVIVRARFALWGERPSNVLPLGPARP
jgi:hypothetical protein